jgi:hypothetical protein
MRRPPEVPATPQSFLAELVATVRRTLPPDVAARVLLVDRQRTMRDRLLGRPGVITRVRLVGPTETLTLGLKAGPKPAGQWSHVYGGETVARRPMTRDELLTTFAGRAAELAAEVATDAAAEAARRTLGKRESGSQVRVRESAIEADLRTLPARLGTRLPREAVAQLGRISDLLIDALPRVAGQGESEIILRRTATVYLPDTLQAYLSLPGDWAAGHVYPDGSTPAQALIAQLGALEGAAQRMRDAALEHDASALLINGRFLSERFAPSRPDPS